MSHISVAARGYGPQQEHEVTVGALPPGPKQPASAADGRLVDAPGGISGARTRPLRQALHDPPPEWAAVRHPLRSRAPQGDLLRAGRRAAPGGGRGDPRAGGREEVADPPRRGRASRAAEAHVAGVPRGEDGAPVGPYGPRLRARGRELADRRADPPAPA